MPVAASENGNGRRGKIQTTASSAGALVITAPQCSECLERKMRVQSMEARCFSARYDLGNKNAKATKKMVIVMIGVSSWPAVLPRRRRRRCSR